jgi:hypothetical protein
MAYTILLIEFTRSRQKSFQRTIKQQINKKTVPEGTAAVPIITSGAKWRRPMP